MIAQMTCDELFSANGCNHGLVNYCCACGGGDCPGGDCTGRRLLKTRSSGGDNGGGEGGSGRRLLQASSSVVVHIQIMVSTAYGLFANNP